MVMIEYVGVAWFAVTATSRQLTVSQFFKQYLNAVIGKLWVTICMDVFHVPTCQQKS